MRKALVATIGALVLAACTEPGAGPADMDDISFKAAGGSQTAQSVMVDFTVGSAIITETQTWTFDPAAAAGAYDNKWTGLVTWTCSPANKAGCLASNKPDTPPAPSALANPESINPSSASCTFFHGGTLPVGSYTQSVEVKALQPPNQGNWHFRYTYVTGGNLVAARTAWSAVTSEDGSYDVPLSGFVVGQSVVSRSSGPWLHKYSHSMRDEFGNPRLSGLSYTLNDVMTPLTPGALELAPSLLYRHGSEYGNVALLSAGDLGGVAEIHNGIIAARNGKPDDFTGNNSAGAELVPFSTAISLFGLAPGSYPVTVSAVVKDNFGSGNAVTSLTRHVVVSGGCQ